jgi:uncharacterized membrane protein
MYIYLSAIAFILAFGGLYVAKYIHERRQQIGHPLVSPIGANDNLVLNSRYSRLFHIPIETIGAIYYTIIVLTYGSFFAFPDLHQAGAALILLEMTIVAFLFSVYLIFVQIFVLRVWCGWCIISAFICAIIFLIEFKFIGYDPLGLTEMTFLIGF